MSVWNHAINHPSLVNHPNAEKLHDEIDKAKNDTSHPLHISNQNGKGFVGRNSDGREDSYYEELHHAANAVHSMANHPTLRDSFNNKEKASVEGASRGKLSDTWKKSGAKNATSKADIKIGTHGISLKKGDSQLMSAEGAETKAAYDHITSKMVEHGHIKPEHKEHIMSKISEVAKHMTDMKGSTAEEAREHRDKAQKIIDDLHKQHPKLTPYIHHEASTGEGKFDGGEGTANIKVTTRKNNSAKIKDLNRDSLSDEDENLSIPRIALPKDRDKETGLSTRPGNLKLDSRVKND